MWGLGKGLGLAANLVAMPFQPRGEQLASEAVGARDDAHALQRWRTWPGLQEGLEMLWPHIHEWLREELLKKQVPGPASYTEIFRCMTFI